MSRPFRATNHGNSLPRALPWADMLRPFRATLSNALFPVNVEAEIENFSTCAGGLKISHEEHEEH